MSNLTYFPAKAGNGKKVHAASVYTYTDHKGQEHTFIQTCCNIRLSNKAWMRRGGNGSFNLAEVEGHPVTCERCQRSLELRDLGCDLKPISKDLNNLVGLPLTARSRKEFRKLVREIIAARTATYIIEEGTYLVKIQDGSVFAISYVEGETNSILVSRKN